MASVNFVPAVHDDCESVASAAVHGDCESVASATKNRTYTKKNFPVYNYVDGARLVVDVSQADLQNLYGRAVGIVKHVVNITKSSTDSENVYTPLKFHDALSWLPKHIAWQNIMVRLGDTDGPFALLGDIWNSSDELFSFAQYHAATLGKVLLDFTDNDAPPHKNSCWIQLHNVLPPKANDCHPKVRKTLFKTEIIPIHTGHIMYKKNLFILSKAISKPVDHIIANAESNRIYMHDRLKVPVTTTPSTPPTKHDTAVPAAPVKKKPAAYATTSPSDKAAGSGASTFPEGMTPQQLQFAMQLAMQMASQMAPHKVLRS